MALIFFGTPRFAVPSLSALVEEKEAIALVVTQPDKVKGRGHVLSYPPIKEVALSRGLKVTQPSSIRSEDFYREVLALRPEFIVVVAYGRILPKEILAVPEKGCINVHASLLPKYRGAAPVQWALIRGDAETGVTTMLMDEGLDTGDVLLRTTLRIEEEDSAETLSVRLSEVGARTLMETLRGIRTGTVMPRAQTGEPSYAPPLRKDMGRVDWNRSALDLSNLVKGTYPWPGAFCTFNGERVKLIRVRPLDGAGVPGRVEQAAKGALIVGTGKGLLLIEELQPEGRKIMSAEAFMAGRKLRGGDVRFS